MPIIAKPVHMRKEPSGALRMLNEGEVCDSHCPRCRQLMTLKEHRGRTVLLPGGLSICLLVPRFRCLNPNCTRKIVTVLPWFLAPYRRYPVKVIQLVIDHNNDLKVNDKSEGSQDMEPEELLDPEYTLTHQMYREITGEELPPEKAAVLDNSFPCTETIKSWVRWMALRKDEIDGLMRSIAVELDFSREILRSDKSIIDQLKAAGMPWLEIITGHIWNSGHRMPSFTHKWYDH